MTALEDKEFLLDYTGVLRSGVSSEYSRAISDLEDKSGQSFYEAVKQNVIECSAWEDEGYYTDDDIRLAIGRVILERLGVST